MSIHIDLMDDRSEKIPYDHADYPAYIRRAFLSSYPNYAAPPHWHDDVEFIVVLNGEMSYNINGEVINLSSGEGVFVNARQMHFGFSDRRMECEFICVIIHPMMLCMTPDVEKKFVLPILQDGNSPYIHMKPETEWQQEIMLGVNAIYDARGASTSVLKIQGIFNWLWSVIYDHMPELPSMESPRDHDLSILKNMVGFIQQNYSDKITLRQISVYGGVGQSKCCKLFHEYLHLTPNAYLISYRLSKAADLLRLTKMTITEIAYSVGFNGASYFAEAFRKCFHISPTEYRDNNSLSSGEGSSCIFYNKFE